MWVCYCGDSAVGRGERKVTYVLGVMGRDADHLVERHLSMWPFVLFYFIFCFTSCLRKGSQALSVVHGVGSPRWLRMASCWSPVDESQ